MILNTGELKQNLTVLALKHLDVGRHDAELVDTVAEHVGGRVVHAVLHLSLEGGANGIVACTGAHDVLEQDGEVSLGLSLAVEIDEGAHEVIALVSGNHLVGTGQGSLEGRVGVAALHGAEHIGHVHLKDNVHTALEVKAEAYAPFAYIIECVSAHIHFLVAQRVHVVLIGLVVSSVVVIARFHQRILGSLIFVLVRNERERKVEQAHQHQADCDKAGNDAS